MMRLISLTLLSLLSFSGAFQLSPRGVPRLAPASSSALFTFKGPPDEGSERKARRRPSKRKQLAGILFGLSLWFRGVPNASIEQSSNAAHAVPSTSRTTFKTKANTITTQRDRSSSSNRRIATGAGTILLATGAGMYVGQAVRRRSAVEQYEEAVDLATEDCSNQEVSPAQIEYAKVGLDEEYEKERTERAKEMVKEILENVFEREITKQEVDVELETPASVTSVAPQKQPVEQPNQGLVKQTDEQVTTVVTANPVKKPEPSVSSRIRMSLPLELDIPANFPFSKYASTQQLPLKSKKYQHARRQPKSPEEEDALKQKYASIEDLSERAYTILVDLGMVEPSDPNQQT